MNEKGSKWYRMTADEVAQQLRTDVTGGLSRKTARARLKRQGFNSLFDSARANTNKLFRIIVPDSACIFMLGTVLLALFFCNLGTSLLALAVAALSVFLLLHLFFGVRSAYADIARYRVPSVSVLRNRRVTSVSARRVVRGDVILFQAGDIVPCDCRIYSARELRVLTLMPNEKGAPVYREFAKNASKVYAYASGVYAPEHENMLYGGSEILEGSARAIAVETGEYTYLGAMSTFRIPAEVHAGDCGEDAVKELRSYTRVYGFLMLALLLVLTPIGVLTSPGEVGVLDVFYPLCVVCGTASPMLMMLYLRLIAAREVESLLRNPVKENRAVVKVGRMMDRMNIANDMVLLGHKACSDGVLHLYSAFCGLRTVDPHGENAMESLQELCEAFVLLSHRSLSAVEEDAFLGEAYDDTLLRELIAAGHFDVDALNIRLVRTEEKEPPQSGDRLIEVQTNTKRFTLLFSPNPHIADRCKLYEDCGRLCTFSAEMKQALFSYCEEAERNACRVLTVVRSSRENGLSLVGAIAMREHIQPTLGGEIAALSRCGVRLSFFLSGDAKYESAFADACGLPVERVIASPEHPHVTEEMLDAFRVFIGYSEEESLLAVQMLQKQRRCAGVLCGNEGDRKFLNAAAFTVVCESTPYHKKGTDETVRTDTNGDGKEYSSHAAQSMRCHADSIIQRATPERGGLAALSEFFFGCRAVGFRMKLLLSYLIPVNMLRVFIAIFCTVLGVGLPAGVWMLYSCFLLDVIALWRILKIKIPGGFLQKPQRISEQWIDQRIFSKEQWLPLLIASGGSSLYCAILRWIGVASQAETASPVLLILLIAQLWHLHLITDRDGLGYERFFLRLPAVQLLLPMVILIPLSILVAPIGTVTGLGEWHPAAAVAVLLFPLIYYIARYFISFFGRTAK